MPCMTCIDCQAGYHEFYGTIECDCPCHALGVAKKSDVKIKKIVDIATRTSYPRDGQSPKGE